MKRILILLSFILIYLTVFSEAMPSFLPYGVNGFSLGNTGTAILNTPAAMCYNPASMGNINSFWAEHTVWYMNSNVENVGFTYFIDKKYGTIGMNVKFTETEDIVGMDEHGDTTGTVYDYNYVEGELNYAYNYDNIYGGLGLIYYIEHNAVRDYKGYMLKLGVLYKWEIELMELNFALSGKNILMKDDIPLEIRFGVYNKLKDIPLKASMDIGYNSVYNVILGIGLQYTIMKMLDINFGYNYMINEPILNGFTGGLGITYKFMKIGYSTSFNDKFGMVHIIGVKFNF